MLGEEVGHVENSLVVTSSRTRWVESLTEQPVATVPLRPDAEPLMEGGILSTPEAPRLVRGMPADLQHLSPFVGSGPARAQRQWSTPPGEARAGLPGTVFRESATVRRTHWCCPVCDLAWPLTMSACKSCEGTRAELSLQGDPETMQAVMEATQHSAYGRRLVCLQGREQPTLQAVGAHFEDAAEFRKQLTAQLGEIGGTKALDDTDGEVLIFCGHLALRTDGKYGMYGDGRAAAFCACSTAEELLAEFYVSMSRRVQVTQADGGTALLLALPKGGWYSRLQMYFTEYHWRLMGFILRLATSSVAEKVTGSRLYAAAMKGTLGDIAMSWLHAVCASVFAHMAHIERGPNGRARSEPLRPTSIAAFAQCGKLQIPRKYVAQIAERAGSACMRHRLGVLEAQRIHKQARQAMVLAAAYAPDGSQVHAWYADGQGICWQPTATYGVGARELVATFDALHLPSFGARVFIQRQLEPIPMPLSSSLDGMVRRLQRLVWENLPQFKGELEVHTELPHSVAGEHCLLGMCGGASWVGVHVLSESWRQAVPLGLVCMC